MERLRTVLEYQYIKFHIKSLNLTTFRQSQSLNHSFQICCSQRKPLVSAGDVMMYFRHPAKVTNYWIHIFRNISHFIKEIKSIFPKVPRLHHFVIFLTQEAILRKQLFTNINISLKRRKFDCDSFPGAAQMLKRTPRNLFWTDLQCFFLAGGRLQYYSGMYIQLKKRDW